MLKLVCGGFERNALERYSGNKLCNIVKSALVRVSFIEANRIRCCPLPSGNKRKFGTFDFLGEFTDFELDRTKRSVLKQI